MNSSNRLHHSGDDRPDANYLQRELNRPRPEVIAVACASLGWPVLPLNRLTGNPALPGYPELATTDPKLIEEWWTAAGGRYVGCLVGILTGQRAGFWALDVDDKNGKNGSEALAALEAEHGPLPRTWKLKTPSGQGYQLWFAYPPDFEIQGDSSGALLGSGLDVKGWHGMVRAPGTRRTTPAGMREYRIVDNHAPVRAPDSLEQRLRRRSGAALSPTDDEVWEPIDLTDWVANAGDVVGNQETYLWRGICSMRGRRVGRTQAVATAWDAASRFENTRPDEPWTYEQVEKKVNSVYSRYPAGHEDERLTELARRIYAGGAW